MEIGKPDEPVIIYKAQVIPAPPALWYGLPGSHGYPGRVLRTSLLKFPGFLSCLTDVETISL
jgi:hypothetical protein